MAERYAIPDIHGCIHTFQYIIENVICPAKNDELYFTGDFINKGPDSKGVLDYVFKLLGKDYHVLSVRGNHEQMLLDVLEDKLDPSEFIVRGGLETLESFNVRRVEDIPDKYIQFMYDLPFYLELDDYYIVHAGFNFSLPDPFTDSTSMLTIRDFDVDPEIIKYKRIIHGHYAKPLDEILYNIIERDGYVLPIDNGCVYTHRAGMGNLFMLNLNNRSYHIQPCIDQHNYEDSVSRRRHYQNGG